MEVYIDMPVLKVLSGVCKAIGVVFLSDMVRKRDRNMPRRNGQTLALRASCQR
jgi:hypothetical protein